MTIAFSADSSASILFENTWSGGGNCFFECIPDNIGAENFILTQASTVESIAFETLTTKTDDLSGLSVAWSIWNDGGSTPTGSALFSGSVIPTLNNLGAVTSTHDRVEYVLDIADFSLAAATYWVGFDVNLTTDSFSIFWGGALSGDSIIATSSNGGTNWLAGYPPGSTSIGRVFSVSGTTAQVPEPSTIALLGLGLAGLGFRKKNKDKY